MKKVAILYNGNEMHFKHWSRRQWHKRLVASQKLYKKVQRDSSTKHLPRWRQIEKAHYLDNEEYRCYAIKN